MVQVTLPRVMGHRGAAAHAPENTLASIRKAAELGAHWVEFDVMLTGDDRPVLFHDDSLKRITGHAGAMADTSYEAVRSLDAGRWFAEEFEGEGIPCLEAALDLAHSLGLRVNIEIKSTLGRDVETAKIALEATAAWWNDGRPPPLISSFSRMSLAVARVLHPHWPRALNAHRTPDDWSVALAALGCTSLHLNSRFLRRKVVRQAKDAGYQVAVFTVNRTRRARALVGNGVDCLITDAPDRIIAAFGANGTVAGSVGIAGETAR